MNIWVILGGMSAEREVSLSTGQAVVQSLMENGHRVWAYDLRDGCFVEELSSPELPSIEEDAAPGWAGRLLQVGRTLREQVEVAFVALHGGEGEGGAVQTLLSTLPMRFTGSGPRASAVSLDKVLTKRIMASLGIPTPPWTVLSVPPVPSLEFLSDTPVTSLPVVVKPIAEGSSVGIGMVREVADWEPALRCAARASVSKGETTQLLVEKYIAGRELTVGVLNGRPLPVVEIRPRGDFYDYRCKYADGESDYQVPAEVEAATAGRLQERAVTLFDALGCSAVARIDFRLSPEEEDYCLELNTIPGLTATSLLPMAARAVGIDFGRLLHEIIEGALKQDVIRL